MKIQYAIPALLLINSTYADINFGDVVTGHEEVYIQEVFAYDLTGSKENNLEHKAICEHKFSNILDHVPLELDYTINVKTGIQWASIKLYNSEVTLQPMGIANQYAFLTQKGVPSAIKELNIRGMHFTLTKAFDLKKVAVMFEDKELDFQCIAEYNL